MRMPLRDVIRQWRFERPDTHDDEILLDNIELILKASSRPLTQDEITAIRDNIQLTLVHEALARMIFDGRVEPSRSSDEGEWSYAATH